MFKDIRYLSVFCLLLVVILGLSSCSSDEEITQEPPSAEYLTKAKDILDGDMVLSTKATMSGEDKTHLDNGCPTKFNFTWKEDGSMTVALVNFTVGTMPFAVTFRCSTKFMNLNTWEKDEYTGGGWVKFQGKDGNVTTQSDNVADNQEGSGATVEGFLNVNTQQIQFIVNYNMMNVRSECFLQIIDKTRIDRFEEEFAQYERDLDQWKIDHGQG